VNDSFIPSDLLRVFPRFHVRQVLISLSRCHRGTSGNGWRRCRRFWLFPRERSPGDL